MINKKAQIVCISLIMSLFLVSCGKNSIDIPKTSAISSEASETSTEASTLSVSTSEISVSETEEPEVSTEPEEEGFRFTRENMPVFDGSTAMIPLGEGILSVLLGEAREDVSDMLDFHKTDEAFYYLLNDEANVVISAEPCDEVYNTLKEANFEIDIEPIAIEGLVFIVNESNPIDSLTSEQIVDIYSGKITNWSEVGGNNEEIVAFQRNPESGSQVMMDKCVMKDTPMVEAPVEIIPALMGELIEGVASYNNEGNAIGYTVYYYADSMNMADGLKIIKVNDVEPNNETIASGEYPYTNPYYCVVKKGLNEDDPARLIYDWLVSEEGQKLVEMEGYVPSLNSSFVK